MTKEDFKANLLTLEGLRLSAKEKQIIVELLNALDKELFSENFFDQLFFALVSSNKSFYLKDFLASFKECLNALIEQLSSKARIKNFNSKLFLQEQELLKRFYKQKLYKSLPAWLIEL